MIPWARQFRRTNLLHITVVVWLLFAQLQLAFGGFAAQLIQPAGATNANASEIVALSDDGAPAAAVMCQISPMDTCCCGLPGKCQCCQSEPVVATNPLNAVRSQVDRPIDDSGTADDSSRSWRACSCHSPMGESIAAVDHPQIPAMMTPLRLREVSHRQPLLPSDAPNDPPQSVELPPPRILPNVNWSFLRATARMVLSQPARDLR